MINYLRHHEIDKRKWDACIDISASPMIYGYSWYLDIVSPGWDALVENDYEAVFPVTRGKKYGVEYLYQPFYSQQLGIFSQSKDREEITAEFLQRIPGRFRLIEINLNYSNKKVPETFVARRNINLELNLEGNYEEIAGNYSSNARRNIAKAINSGNKFCADIIPEKIITLFRSNRGRNISTIKERHYIMLRNLIDIMRQKQLLTICGIEGIDGAICSGAIFVKSFDRQVFLFSGSDMRAKKTGANFLLIDSFIRANCRRAMILDFEGSNDLNLSKFYRGFGAKEKSYLSIRRNSLPLQIRMIHKIIKFLKTKLS